VMQQVWVLASLVCNKCAICDILLRPRTALLDNNIYFLRHLQLLSC